MKNYQHTKNQWIKWYKQKNELLAEKYSKASPDEVYRAMFENLQTRGSKDDSKGNGMIDIIAYYPNDRKYTRKYILTDDFEALKYMKPLKKSKELFRLCLCSPCTYYGNHKTNAMAHTVNAVILDLDYVGIQQLKNIVKQIGNGARIMPPNYIVNSGRGLHFYYLLKEPIPAYGYMIEQLTKFKAILEDFIWNETSSLKPDKPDHGAITQAFRMVGAETKLGKEYPVVAFKVREERWSIEELYMWVNSRASSFLKGFDIPTLREPLKVYREKHPLTLAEAKEKYPNWEPNKKVSKWTNKPDLYYWWIKQIQEKAIVGGRYYSILALAAYASKCDIPYKQLEKDALELVPYLDTLTDDEVNHFTKSDVYDALSFYKRNKKEVTYKLTRDRIAELSKIEIQANKRNGRKQKTHLKIARATLEIMNEDRGKALQGRPDKQQIVEDWQKANPSGTKAECNRATGIDPKTIRKWWN